MASEASRHSHYRKAVWLCLAYLVFVVYGSLVPLEFRPYTLEQALERFANIPWLNLGATKRADWIANAVLYIPLAFLACTVMAGPRRHRLSRFVAVTLAVIACGLVAVGVEFTQIFFSPRTVSLNDLLAEGIGIAIGATVWLLWRPQLTELWRDFHTGGRRSLAAAIVALSIAYLGLALFPYDFVISLEELRQHLGPNSWGLVLANWHENPLRILMRLAGEMAALVPLGLLLGLLANQISLKRAFAAGVILGLCLELLQLLLVSGVSQGISLFTRGAGLAGGAWLGRQLLAFGLIPLARWVQRLSWPAWPVYTAALLGIAGWFQFSTRSLSVALAQLDRMEWMPFYYHYYTTEPVALASLLANFTMYAPVGLLAWARHTLVPRRQRHGAWQPALWGATLAIFVEASKLWLHGHHPDPTNVLIGASGAASIYMLSMWLARVIKHPVDLPPESDCPPETATRDTHPQQPAWWQVSRPTMPTKATRAKQTVAIVLGVAMIGLLTAYPIAQWPLGIALLLYVVALSYNPRVWLLVIPALVPSLDLVSYSGWFYWESIDFFIVATIFTWLWFGWTSRIKPDPALRTQTRWALLVGTTVAIGTINGLWPLPPADTNAFNNYFSNYNALRVAKGFFWALLLLPLMQVTLNERKAFTQYLIPGAAIGFLLVTARLLAERVAFPGLFDFETDFRVTAGFSSMHTGGGHIEAYLALVLPLLVAGVLLNRLSLQTILLGILLAAVGSYALLVTYSRAGIVALGLSLAVLSFGMLTKLSHNNQSGRKIQAVVLAILIAVTVFAALPALKGSYLQDRLASAQGDWQTRVAHWQNTLDMMDGTLGTTLFGTGLGRFPESYFFYTLQSNLLGHFSFGEEQGQRYLRLTGGDPLYYEQTVNLDSDQVYTVDLELRTSALQPNFKVAVCTKSLLYSQNCHWLTVPKIQNDANWHDYQLVFRGEMIGNSQQLARQTTKLSLFNPMSGSQVDVNRIQVTDSDGRRFIDNGDFSDGHSHWFFSTDNHLPWHIKQLWIQLYYEQGALGVIVFTMFAFFVVRQLFRVLLKGDILAAGFASGIMAFLSIGLFASLFDAPRLTLMFLLLSFAGLQITRITALPRAESPRF